MKLNKDFMKGYISVPDVGRIPFSDMEELEYPENYGGDRAFRYNNSILFANPEYMAEQNWRAAKTNRKGKTSGMLTPDYRDLKALEYQKTFGENTEIIDPNQNRVLADGGEYLELDENEIQAYRDGGYVVEEFDGGQVMELAKAEIKKFRDGGYIVEEY